jgi:hypothetical protein
MPTLDEITLAMDAARRHQGSRPRDAEPQWCEACREPHVW